MRVLFQPGNGDALYPFAGGTLNKRLRVLLKAVGLPERAFTAGGLRAGGATHYLRAGASVEWLRHRGRWSAPSSMEHYLQECAAVLAEQRMNADTRQKLMAYSQGAEIVLVQTIRRLAGRIAVSHHTSPFRPPPQLRRQAPAEDAGANSSEDGD